MHSHRKRTLVNLSVFLALAALWLFGLVPTQVGGTLTSMVVSGISMEPNIHAGELVVLRQRPEVRVGDIAAYRNAYAKATFLHRVVARQAGGYVFKGDNLAWRDPGVAARSQIKGVLWFKVPVVGRAVAWLQVPLHGALVAAGALVLLGCLPRRRRCGAPGAEREKPPVSRRPTLDDRRMRRPEQRLVILAAACGLAALACAAGIALTLRPGQATPHKAPPDYTHTGRFGYSAPVKRSAVYPKGAVTPDDPFFPAMISKLGVRYTYRLETRMRSAVEGIASLRLSVQSSAGWSRTIVVAQPKRFTGTTAHVSGEVDLAAVRRLVTEVDVLTGSPGTYTATLEASVQTRGSIGGVAVDDAYTAELPLQLAQPARPDPSALESSAGRSLPGAPATPPPTGLAGRRPFGIAAFVLLASAAAGAWALLRRRLESYDEPARIAIRHGRLLTPLALRPATTGSELEVSSMDDLVRIAKTYGTAIFSYGDAASGVEYLTQANGAVHRYSIAAQHPELAGHQAR